MSLEMRNPPTASEMRSGLFGGEFEPPLEQEVRVPANPDFRRLNRPIPGDNILLEATHFLIHQSQQPSGNALSTANNALEVATSALRATNRALEVSNNAFNTANQAIDAASETARTFQGALKAQDSVMKEFVVYTNLIVLVVTVVLVYILSRLK